MLIFGGKKKIINVYGMKCKNCSEKVVSVLMEFENVSNVKVNLDKGEVIIKYKNGLDDGEIISAIENLEYKVNGIKDLN